VKARGNGAQENSQEVPTISVVIPTVGRPTLRAAVDSIRRQSVPPDEIVIVNDSEDQLSVISELGVDVTEEFTGGGRGPSAARNRGVSRARGEFIAYLDDDDLWFPHHLATALQSFEKAPELDLYACTMIESQPSRLIRSSEVEFRGREDLVDFFYGRYCWASRRRSIPPSTWVFRRETCNLAMDEDLRVREDMWLLLNLDRRGKTLRQSATPGGVWFSDPTRNNGRESAEILVDWAQRIEGLRHGAGLRFILGVMGRYYARTGMRDEWVELVGSMPCEWRISWDYRLIRAFENLSLRRPRRWGREKT
jgi:glycosyltransferase involved in cell wall biosynthesis